MKTIRLTLELREVTIGGVKYLSDMPQHVIDKHKDYYSETHGWLPVLTLADLEHATNGEHCLDNAEDHTFIKVPTKEGTSALVTRILNHFPGVKIESVEDLGFQAMVENSRKNTATTAENVESFTSDGMYVGGSEMIASLARLADDEGDSTAIKVAENYQSVLESILETGSEDERKAAAMLMQRVTYVIGSLTSSVKSNIE